ncbi:sodium-dependent transporter [Methanimicrococcus sp. OttesenSCG-928-J09]|nr:sodium-dependent transporter [Methanimicrococcus sp. OttesenSCG-928-J09]
MRENKQDSEKRENFTSQLGFILVTVSSAVGLGNIWRFSYITGVNGGGAFLLIYMLCVLFVAMPIMIAEFSIGRKGKLSPVGSFKKLAPDKRYWIIPGILSILSPLIIMIYYPVVSGWALGYVFESVFNWGTITSDPSTAFSAFAAAPKSILFTAAALIMTAGVLIGGVTKGIEKSSKILMPILFLLLLILVLRSLTLPGSFEGVKFLFVPDFAKLTLRGVLDALGHSFYSLSLGMGIIITYASYMKKETDLPKATASIITLDTAVALLSGLAIFPAVFALGINPAEGAGLAFVTLPGAFAQIPAGQIFSVTFFLLLFIAALTSMISLMQIPLAFLEEEYKMKKKTALMLITAFLIIAGIPSALSFGPLSDMLIFGNTYFDAADKLVNIILLPITGLLCTLFVIFHLGIKNSKQIFMEGAKNQNSILGKIYPFSVKYIAPIAIVLIMLNGFGLFNLIFN